MNKISILAITLCFVCGCSDTEVSWHKVKEASTDAINLKVYVENSGSMDGYMCDGSEFKDAVFGYITNLSNHVSKTDFYYINSSIILDKTPLEKLSATLNPASFDAAGGNRGETNIANMFGMMLKNSDRNTVSVFISDCILALPQHLTKNFLINNEIQLNAIFGKGLKSNPNLGVIVYRMISRFSGKYYNSAGVTTIDQPRPYYIWVFGDCSLLAKLNKEVDLKDMPNADVRNSVAFAPQHDIPFNITNASGYQTSDSSCVLRAENNEKFRMNLLVDFSSTLQDETYFLEKSNYINPARDISIDAIEKIKDSKSKFTHLIMLSTPQTVRPLNEKISFVKPGLPKWIDTFNDASGLVIAHKTTGIKNIIKGVSDAYGGNDSPAEINFAIKLN